MGSPEIQDSRVGWYKMMFIVCAGKQPGLYPVDTAQPLKNWKQRTHLTRLQHEISDWESVSLFHYFPSFLLTRPILLLSFLLPSQINSFFSYSFHWYGFCWPWMLENHECREVVLPASIEIQGNNLSFLHNPKHKQTLLPNMRALHMVWKWGRSDIFISI